MHSQAEDRSDLPVSVVVVNMAALFSELLCSAFAVDGSVQIVASVRHITELAEVLDGCVPDVALIGAQGFAHEVNASSTFLQELGSMAPSIRSIVIAPSRSDLGKYGTTRHLDRFTFISQSFQGHRCSGRRAAQQARGAGTPPAGGRHE